MGKREKRLPVAENVWPATRDPAVERSCGLVRRKTELETKPLQVRDCGLVDDGEYASRHVSRSVLE